eukprot:359071-Chlamydomonas_euryale.AAC.10
MEVWEQGRCTRARGGGEGWRAYWAPGVRPYLELSWGGRVESVLGAGRETVSRTFMKHCMTVGRTDSV